MTDLRANVSQEQLGSKKRQDPQRGWQWLIKRALDVAAATLGIILLSPVLLAAILLIRITMGKPILFRQVRPGKYACPFTLMKFRTMNDARDGEGRLLSDAQRVTKPGRWLRTCSVDELPQLWNVMRGNMSLVGPRPLLMEYLDRYTAEQARRHEVLPGITGWAQINGRNALSWDEKFVLDVWYVDHWSLALDLKILAKTVWRVLTREGISGQGHATMPEFLGCGEHAHKKM
jgi:lipopolysaccharide/colanic/teichoic acid biosynthesis glycosyltransferase